MTWNSVIPIIRPELILIAVACALFLLGVSSKVAARKLAPVLALLALLVAFGVSIMTDLGEHRLLADPVGAFRVGDFAMYIKMIAAGVGALLVLLAWPTDPNATGNPALEFGNDAGEFFALLLLSIAGIFLVSGANDLILLFLGIELASIPTYIMVSISRPLPAAQEAGVKYFFLGAMAAAIMLFGFSYLYGSTGLIDLSKLTAAFSSTITQRGQAATLTPWQMLAALMLIAGFAFKIAAVPLHFYAGDVYEGAATPVTALLSFVPKTAGFVALIKVLHTLSGGAWGVPDQLVGLLWIMAALTMTVGNVLGLMQQNVKRVLAYSSIAHSGYMLVGLTVALNTRAIEGIQGVLFYLAAYGMMNVAAFGVLLMLPSRSDRPATSAETFDDLAGTGRRNLGLGLAMAVACFSLIGLPLTVGFFGKIYLIRPALIGADPANIWLVVIMMINAAISAAYYLRIVGVMFLRSEPPAVESGESPAAPQPPAMPILIAICLSTAATLMFGVLLPATEVLHTSVIQASHVDSRIPELTAEAAQP